MSLPLPRPAAIVHGRPRVVPPGKDEPRANPVRLLLDRCRHARIREHDGLPATHDAGLLEAYGFDVVAQPLAMIERHVGDQAGIGLNGVYGIQPPAHANLENRRIDVHDVEYGHRSKRAVFEVSQRNILARCLNAFERGNDLRITGWFAVDADTFVVVDDMRRRVGADDSVRRGQQGSQHGNAGTLAIGAGDMNDA